MDISLVSGESCGINVFKSPQIFTVYDKLIMDNLVVHLNELKENGNNLDSLNVESGIYTNNLYRGDEVPPVSSHSSPKCCIPGHVCKFFPHIQVLNSSS